MVVLAAGAVFATGVLRDDSSGPPAAPPTGGSQLDLALAAKALDRCWAAAKSHDGTVPARRDWAPLFTVKHGDAAVVAAMIGDRSSFCEAILTSVTVSDLPAAPAPLVTAVDRPAPAERSSEAGQFLGQCLAAAQQQLPDRDAYVAGAYLSWNSRELVVARLGQSLLTCSARPDPRQQGAVYYAINPVPGAGELESGPASGVLFQVLAPVKDTGGPERSVLAEAVPENVTRVSVTYPGGRPQEAAVAHGTFAIWHTDDSATVVDPRTTVKAYDAAGRLVIEATLKLF